MKQKDKEEKIDINCMLHKCKRCPKQRECEQEMRGDNNAKTKKVQQSRRYAK